MFAFRRDFHFIAHFAALTKSRHFSPDWYFIPQKKEKKKERFPALI